MAVGEQCSELPLLYHSPMLSILTPLSLTSSHVWNLERRTPLRSLELINGAPTLLIDRLVDMLLYGQRHSSEEVKMRRR